LKSFRQETGISLLEVLVAVAIVSIALVSFVTLVIGALDVEDHARRITEATSIADEKLKEIERSPFPETGRTEGQVEEKASEGFTYNILVQDTQLKDVREIDVEISWDHRRRSVTLIGYVARR
jgi:general secretion pathway protein I